MRPELVVLPRRAAVLALLAGAACARASGGPAGLDEPVRWAGVVGPIVNGAPDTEPAHRAVVALLARGYMCSGTLIAPRIVLTAGHCADGFSAADFRVGFGDAVDRQATWVRASRVQVHPQYREQPPRYDLALLELASAAPADVKPIPPLPAGKALGAADIGAPLHFSGFGEDEQGRAGRKLQVVGSLGFVCDQDRSCRWDYLSVSPRTLCYDQQPGGPCSGDSGGPAFVTRDGVLYVAGVTSYGDEDCAFLGCSTKVDAFEAFIAEFVAGSPGTPCSGSTDCRDGACVGGLCCAGCDAGCGRCDDAGAPGTCTPEPDGTACDDGDRCTTGDRCLSGRCAAKDVAFCPVTDPCRVGVRCEPSTGQCVSTPRADGIPCSTGDLCRLQESCRAGACVAAAQVQCEPRACQVGACEPASGVCRYEPAPDGSACEADGSTGTCAAGACETGCGCGAGAPDALAGLLALALLRRARRQRSR